jgi:hypothetical protein
MVAVNNIYSYPPPLYVFFSLKILHRYYEKVDPLLIIRENTLVNASRGFPVLFHLQYPLVTGGSIFQQVYSLKVALKTHEVAIFYNISGDFLICIENENSNEKLKHTLTFQSRKIKFCETFSFCGPSSFLRKVGEDILTTQRAYLFS